MIAVALQSLPVIGLTVKHVHLNTRDDIVQQSNGNLETIDARFQRGPEFDWV